MIISKPYSYFDHLADAFALAERHRYGFFTASLTASLRPPTAF